MVELVAASGEYCVYKLDKKFAIYCEDASKDKYPLDFNTLDGAIDHLKGISL